MNTDSLYLRSGNLEYIDEEFDQEEMEESIQSNYGKTFLTTL